MKRYFLLCVLILLGLKSGIAGNNISADSVEVEKWLSEALRSEKAADNYPLFFSSKLLGRPYVASTLEVNRREQLVVNVRELDCTTFVENVVAMTLTVQNGKKDFATFKSYLEKIRYRDGRCNGYPSRNHYFSEWIESNVRLGLVEEIGGKPFTGKQTVNVNYMSSHPDKYPMLKENEADIKKIRQNERAVSQRVVAYIPNSKLNAGKSELNMVHDGDILALVTKKSGLDISHVGFAVWGKDGKLHLINASSLHKKVVSEPMTLYEYMKKHPSNLGVRVIRIRCQI